LHFSKASYNLHKISSLEETDLIPRCIELLGERR
jgi:hypothetical protein